MMNDRCAAAVISISMSHEDLHGMWRSSWLIGVPTFAKRRDARSVERRRLMADVERQDTVTIDQYISGMRVRTLALSVAPVWIGTAAGVGIACERAAASSRCTVLTGGASCMPDTARIVVVAVLCLLVAMLLQIAANFVNDYSDGIRGTDAHRAAGAVAARLDDDLDTPADRMEVPPARLVASGVPPRHVLAAAVVNAALACTCGLAVVVITGYWWLIVVGALCLAAGWYYVGGRRPYGYMGFGEVAVFVFFGLVATLGTTYAIAGALDAAAWVGASAIGLVAVAVLCVNNLRDINTDRAAGKRTWAVRMGRTWGTVCTIALIAIVSLGAAVAWVATSVQGERLAHLSVLYAFLGILGAVCALLTGWFAALDIAKRNYMRAMRSLGLLALATALTFNGFALMI